MHPPPAVPSCSLPSAAFPGGMGRREGIREGRAAYLEIQAATAKGLESTLLCRFSRALVTLGLPIKWLRDWFWWMALGGTSPFLPQPHLLGLCPYSCLSWLWWHLACRAAKASWWLSLHANRSSAELGVTAHSSLFCALPRPGIRSALRKYLNEWEELKMKVFQGSGTRLTLH